MSARDKAPKAGTAAAAPEGRRSLRVLYVEDRPADAELTLRELKRSGFDVTTDMAETADAFRAKVRTERYDVILADYGLQGWTGMDAFDITRELGLDTPFILVTGSLGDEAAVDCVKRGVADYVLKDRLSRISVAIRRALEQRDLRAREAAATAALQASEQRYRALTEQSTDLIVIVDAEARIIYASPSVTHILGYESKDLLGELTFYRIHPDDQQRVRTVFAGVMAGGQASSPGQFRFRHRDGSWRVLESVVTNLLRDPVVSGVVVNLRDITERRQTEETLRWEQFLMLTLMDNVPDAIYFKDASSRFIRINRSLARLFGLSDPAQAVGRTDSDFFTPEHAEAARKTEEEVIRTGQPVLNIEEMETWPDRPPTWASSTKMPMRDASGAIIGTFGISRDITERKRAEEALRTSEAEHRGLVEYAPLAIYRATRAGRFLMVNPALVRMLGYGSVEEVLRLDIARDVYADPAERERLLRGDASVPEVAWKRKDGTHIAVRISSRVIPADSEEGAFNEGLVEDVTEQRNLENQFRQAQRLEAVGRLAGGVAHDFNNILTVIAAFSAMLLQDFAENDPRRQDVEEIRLATQRATDLTRQLLAFSRRQVLRPKVLNLNAVVASLEKMLRRMIGEDVALDIRLDQALGATRTDAGQIEQVILNLAVNARDAMPGGGTLRIETRNAEIDEDLARDHPPLGPGQFVMLSVIDTGIGMDTETRSHIFEPFFTTKDPGKGTGLGLATVYGIVKQSQGFVFVTSEPGHGARFDIYLPRVNAPVDAPDMTPGGAVAAGGREVVLLAEDEVTVREVMASTLRQKGYDVIAAPDGRSALAMARARTGTIDLLVTDMIMPGMTGRELAEALVAERQGVRVLYMTGYTDDVVAQLDEGTPCLQKPFTPSALALKVREVLDRR